jgi:hypothetical protein
MTIVQNQARQRDVLLIRVPQHRAASPVAPEDGRLVLAHGEVTGHHHSFALADRIALFREDGSGGGLFLSVGGDAPAKLEHQEHSTIPIAPGTYRALRQRTFHAGMARRVAD